MKANGKFPLEPEERREYYAPEDSIPRWNGDECGRLKAGFLKLDIDDRDHKTEQLIDPIHDQPRSDAVKAWLDSKKIHYNLMITEHGKHFYSRFRQTSHITRTLQIGIVLWRLKQNGNLAAVPQKNISPIR